MPLGHHWQGRHACCSHEWKILSPAAACLSLLTSAGTKEQKSTPTACPRFFAFLPPHSTPPSMIHGSIRNKLNQPTTLKIRQNGFSAHPGHGTWPARSNSVRTGKILACLVMCRTTEWLLPSSTVSREPTILVELSFMIPDLFPCNRHKNQGHTKATQVHSNRAETHDLFLKQKLAILIRFELYFDK